MAAGGIHDGRGLAVGARVGGQRRLPAEVGVEHPWTYALGTTDIWEPRRRRSWGVDRRAARQMRAAAPVVDEAGTAMAFMPGKRVTMPRDARDRGRRCWWALGEEDMPTWWKIRECPGLPAQAGIKQAVARPGSTAVWPPRPP